MYHRLKSSAFAHFTHTAFQWPLGALLFGARKDAGRKKLHCSCHSSHGLGQGRNQDYNLRGDSELFLRAPWVNPTNSTEIPAGFNPLFPWITRCSCYVPKSSSQGCCGHRNSRNSKDPETWHWRSNNSGCLRGRSGLSGVLKGACCPETPTPGPRVSSKDQKEACRVAALPRCPKVRPQRAPTNLSFWSFLAHLLDRSSSYTMAGHWWRWSFQPTTLQKCELCQGLRFACRDQMDPGRRALAL